MVLRELTEDDEDAFLTFFDFVPKEDAKFLKHNIKDKRLLKSWIEELDFKKTLSIIVEKEQLKLSMILMEWLQDGQSWRWEQKKEKPWV